MVSSHCSSAPEKSHLVVRSEPSLLSSPFEWCMKWCLYGRIILRHFSPLDGNSFSTLEVVSVLLNLHCTCLLTANKYYLLCSQVICWQKLNTINAASKQVAGNLFMSEYRMLFLSVSRCLQSSRKSESTVCCISWCLENLYWMVTSMAIVSARLLNSTA